MSPKTMPIAPIDELVQRPLGVAVRGVVRRLGFGASSRGDVHAVEVQTRQTAASHPLAPRAEVVGHGRARTSTAVSAPAIGGDRGEKPVYRPAQPS